MSAEAQHICSFFFFAFLSTKPDGDSCSSESTRPKAITSDPVCDRGESAERTLILEGAEAMNVMTWSVDFGDSAGAHECSLPVRVPPLVQESNYFMRKMDYMYQVRL